MSKIEQVPGVSQGTPGATPRDKDEPPVLEAVGIVKHYPVKGGALRRGSAQQAVHAVDEVDIALHRGRVVALVGESGSGKSTTARLLAQLQPVTDGRIELHGKDATARRRRTFLKYVRRVQMIFQDPFASLNPVHPVRYTLTRAVRIHRGRLRGQALEDALTELLGRVHLTPAERYIDCYPHELSGGQRQRVAIARALAADPEVLLADEPISMLDVSIRLGILNLLADLRDRLHLAILYITHDIASARYFADTTHVMYAGRVVESGDSESVTQDPQHPYTRMLVASAPDPDRLSSRDGERDREQARGEPPSLVDPPPGCRFAPRCPYANDLCRSETPVLVELGTRPGAEPRPDAEPRRVACWGYTERDDAPEVAR